MKTFANHLRAKKTNFVCQTRRCLTYRLCHSVQRETNEKKIILKAFHITVCYFFIYKLIYSFEKRKLPAMSANRVRSRESKSGETVAYSEAAIRHNASAVEYCRTSMAALSGSTAGMKINFNE